MKGHIAVRGFLAVLALAVAAPLLAQAPPQPHGRISVFGSNIETVLKAPALSGRPSFDITGHYWGLQGEVETGKWSLAARYTTGRNKVLPGATDQTSPAFHPLSGERRDIIDVVVGYRVLRHAVVGDVDVAAGYLRVWAGPEVSPANWYDGPQLAVKGRRGFTNGMTFSYKVAYVPTYTVKGYVHKALEQDDIIIFRAEGEIPVRKNIYLTAGYEHLRFEAVSTLDRSRALIELAGPFVGAGFRF